MGKTRVWWFLRHLWGFSRKAAVQDSFSIYHWKRFNAVGINPTGSSWSHLTTSAVFRDIGWYHVVMLVDTTQSTESDRTKIYMNGVQQTNFSSSGYVGQNTDTPFNNTNAHSISRYEGENSETGYYINGHLSNVYLIDGHHLDLNILDLLTDSLILGNLKSILEPSERMVSTSRWMETHQLVKINLEEETTGHQ